ncbi:MAG: DUF983 domain-containing protein [Acetobacteraceae bacterium]|nr:DUF983 domain-containing protein [Acetobacteraceae bacterium]
MEWQPARSRPTEELWQRPKLGAALARGIANRCPACGQGRLFAGFLRIVERCEGCDAPLGRIRADDAPPYFTIFLVGHIIVPLLLWVERAWAPEIWLMSAIFLPLSGGLAVGLIRPVKGATVGLMMRLGLSDRDHGPDPLAGG